MLIYSIAICSLYATITATYKPQSNLTFKLGSEVSTEIMPTGTFSANKLVAHLGTIRISTEGESLIRPLIVNYNSSNWYTFYGQFNRWNYTPQNTDFGIWAFTSISHSPFQVWLGSSETSPNNHSTSPISANPYVIDLFLVSMYNSRFYEEEEEYEHVAGTFGSFNIKVLNFGWYGTWYYDYISVDEQELPPNGRAPYPPIPLIGSGSTTVAPIPYGEGSTPAIYSLTIFEDAPFTVQQAYGAARASIASAQITLENAKATEDYGVEIDFSSTSYDDTFNLHLGGLANQYAIPYSLQFLNEEVISGVPIIWDDLINGINSQDIYVTNINATVADRAPAGEYSDIITVTITPIE